ncbi:hypothetical protein E2542_SST21783 [Spatholobus suberectus]|nr:hypothetical protein E2542_SST21783 [Spatholobus suberectus]
MLPTLSTVTIRRRHVRLARAILVVLPVSSLSLLSMGTANFPQDTEWTEMEWVWGSLDLDLLGIRRSF